MSPTGSLVPPLSSLAVMWRLPSLARPDASHVRLWAIALSVWSQSLVVGSQKRLAFCLPYFPTIIFVFGC